VDFLRPVVPGVLVLIFFGRSELLRDPSLRRARDAVGDQAVLSAACHASTSICLEFLREL
jgi:hypothetical protein